MGTPSRDRGLAAAAGRRLPNRSPGPAVAARGLSRGPSPSRGPAPSPRARDLQAGGTARTVMSRSPKATQNHARDRQLRRTETPGDRDQGPPPRMGTPPPTRMATLLGTIEQLRTHLEIFKGIFSIFTQQANCSQNTPCDQLVHTTTRRVLHLSSIQICLSGNKVSTLNHHR